MRRLVVVGNGMAAHRLVSTLARAGAEESWHITVLGEETRPAYDRVGLSRYVEGATEQELRLPPPPGEPDIRLGAAVTDIDRAERAVHTASGLTVPYEVLVLATGSVPFVPPITGVDRARYHVYRTLDDLDAIMAAAKDARRGVVVGGGLLGLEAANALRLLGLDTHVIERAPHLMPAQVDTPAGALIARSVGELGVTTHVDAAISHVESDRRGHPTAVSFGDTVLPTDLLVVAAGIRPRDELAATAGIERGERGGVAVDDACRTNDPAIYAIGECASHHGTVYGLVAPTNAMADTVAERLLGGTSRFTGGDTSTKLKLLGVDVASFGDTRPDDASGTLDVVINDSVTRRYAKLVLSDDARTLLGGTLVGDASAYARLRPLVGAELPGDPLDLLAPGTGAIGPGELAGDTQICSCNGVTKTTLCAAIDAGATDVPALKSQTRAATTCGSCVPALTALLRHAGVEQSSALCEHFTQSRADLMDVVRTTGIATFSELLDRFGTGRGCDVCKPTVASILATTARRHVLDGEDASIQDTNDHFLANLQRNGSYSVVPRIPGGEITPERLIVIGEIARDFGLYTKITGAQRIDLLGARVDQLPAVWARLVEAGMESGHAYGKAVRTVKSCVGTTWCRYGVQDSVSMAIELELRYRGLRAPHKIKAAVSGCARECAEARSKDIGVIATENGWNLYVGGNGGFTPAHAQLLASDLDSATLRRYIDRYLMYYIRTADRLQRTARWIEDMDGGLERLHAVVVDDALGIADDLERDMEAHVASYSDEWRDVLEDPEKRARFVSFANAPDTVDPTITFETIRDQPVPSTPVDLGTPTTIGGTA